MVYVVSDSGVHASPTKVKALVDWPKPILFTVFMYGIVLIS